MLLSSNTNVAVDRVLENLLEKGFTQFVRIGNKKRVAKGILPHTTAPTASISGGSSGSGKRNSGGGAKSASDQSQAQDLPTLSTSRIVGATCLATLGDALDHERFGVVILDECSQLTEPLSLLPQRFGVRHLICVGDPRQLPPTLESDPSHPDHLEKTLFERLERAGCPVAVLDAQYRCHPSISRISNTLFYDSRLVDGDPDGATSRVAVPGLPPVAIIDTAAAGNGAAATEAYVPRARTYINVAEANEVVRAYHVLTRGLGVRPGDIGIIALYRGQADRIRSMLAAASVPTNEDTTNVTVVSTVDAFQGQEKSIVLVSTVRTAKLGTFAADARRLNVMLTRARAHLLVFGHARLLATAEIWRRI
ncbi:AAA domain-containing protein, partial [Blastocladiella britannica]